MILQFVVAFVFILRVDLADLDKLYFCEVHNRFRDLLVNPPPHKRNIVSIISGAPELRLLSKNNYQKPKLGP